MYSKHVEVLINKCDIEKLCVKLVTYQNYTKMYGSKNIRHRAICYSSGKDAERLLILYTALLNPLWIFSVSTKVE